MTDNLADLKKAHIELMQAYVDVINQVSKLQFFVTMYFVAPLEWSKLLITFRPKHAKLAIFYDIFIKFMMIFLKLIKIPTMCFFIKLLVESHIKGKLKQLGDSYVQFEQTIEVDEPKGIVFYDWLKQTEEGTKKFANTLPTLQSIRGFLIAFLPWFTSLLIAILSADNIQKALGKLVQSSTQAFTFELLITITILYFFLFFTIAFMFKRNLFYTISDSLFFIFINDLVDVFKSSKLFKHSEKRWHYFPFNERSYKNIYKLEDELFDMLGKRKNQELPIDYIILSIIYFVYGISIISLDVPSGLFSLFLGYFILISGFERRWR